MRRQRKAELPSFKALPDWRCSLLTDKREPERTAVPEGHESPSGAFKPQTGLRSKCRVFSAARSQRFRRAGAGRSLFSFAAQKRTRKAPAISTRWIRRVAAAAPRRGAGAPSPSAPDGRSHLSQRERQEALPLRPWLSLRESWREAPERVRSPAGRQQQLPFAVTALPVKK